MARELHDELSTDKIASRRAETAQSLVPTAVPGRLVGAVDRSPAGVPGPFPDMATSRQAPHRESHRMKIIPWILIGSRIFALSFGLTLLAGGCGDSSSGTGSSLSQEEQKRNEDSKKAMEDAAKATRKK